jgi:hypothetical protein
MSSVVEHTQMAHQPTPNGHSEAPPAEAAPRPRRSQGHPRVLTHPQDVMALVLRQIDTVNTTRDELTIALKRLMDLTKQLTRAYAAQARAIQALQARVKALEAQTGPADRDLAGNGAAPPGPDRGMSAPGVPSTT